MIAASEGEPCSQGGHVAQSQENAGLSSQPSLASLLWREHPTLECQQSLLKGATGAHSTVLSSAPLPPLP